MPNPDSPVDQLDEQIIGYLRQNGREANTEIARQLGVSEATVRNRIQNLVGAGVLQIVAVTNPTKLGMEVDVAIGLECEVGQIINVATALAAMDEIRYVAHVSGPFDLFANGLFRTKADLSEFLTVRLAAIPGIRRAEPWHHLRIFKRGFEHW